MYLIVVEKQMLHGEGLGGGWGWVLVGHNIFEYKRKSYLGLNDENSEAGQREELS